MEKLKVRLGPRSYEISISEGILGGIGQAVKGLGFSSTIALVSNETVFGLYGSAVRESLEAAGFSVSVVVIPDGEGYKTFQWVDNILGELLGHRLDRGSCVVALGGGVIGDIAGFAASIYMRGISFVQVPTTLLAQVDSSVGGKTGVNHPLGKNLIGTFWQPSLVWIDVGTLRTLPEREFLAGMVEVIKYGVIWDEDFFEYLIKNRERIMKLEAGPLTHIIKRSCEIKAEVVSEDEREAGLRAILNLGHTFGHAVETVTGYTKYLHGEAVSIGMCVESALSETLGLCDKITTERIRGALELYGLPVQLPEGVDKDALVDAMKLDKKTLGGEIRFVLPEGIGRARINEKVGKEALRSFLGAA